MPENFNDEFQKKLSGQMEGVFDLVLKERESHYKNSSLPSINDVNSIVFNYTTLNAGISGGLNLIPGPLGLLAIIPEMVLIIRNQLAMICDLSYAYRGSKILSKETLLYVFGSALGTGGLGFAVIQGNKLLVKRVSLRVFQRIIGWLGGKITQKALKAFIAKWFPIVGAAAMAAWTHYTTNQVGQKAIEIFSKYEINNVDSEIIDADVITVESSSHFNNNSGKNPRFVYIQALINLMKIDDVIKDVEKEFVLDTIKNSNLSQEEIVILKEKINTSPHDRFEIDFSPIKNNIDLVTDLLTDMVLLAKRDNEFHPKEKSYIEFVAEILGVNKEDLNRIMG